MPSWIIHLATATKISKMINVSKNEFLLGNVLPDQGKHVIKDLEKNIAYKTTHFQKEMKVETKIECFASPKDFLRKYKKEIENPIVLGYYVHLLTDYYWNFNTYINYSIRNEKGDPIGVRLNNGEVKVCSKEERAKIKHKDFIVFATKLLEEEEIEYPHYCKEMIEDINKIEEIQYTQADIKKIIQYADEMIKQDIENRKKIQNTFRIYTQKEIEKCYKESIEYIQEKIKLAIEEK